MARKKEAIVVFLFVSLCAGLYGLSRLMTISHVAHAQVSAVPFTIEQWTFGSDGKLTESRTTARRSDGSEAVVSHLPAAAPIKQITNADGSTASFVDDFKAKMSYKKTTQERARRVQIIQHPPDDCVEMPFSGIETVLTDPDLSYRTSQLAPDDLPVKTIPIIRQNGPQRHIELRAPSLGCFPVAVIHDIQTKQGGWVSMLEVKAIYLKVGEPESVLFVPSDAYKEMKPSELRKAALIRQGITQEQCPICFKSNWDIQADAAYASRQH